MRKYWKNKKVLVSGGAGFIGSHVVDALVQKGAKVIVQVSPNTSDLRINQNLQNYIKKIKIVKANLEDEKSCMRICARKDVVLNFAGLDGGSTFKREHTAEIFRTNSKIVVNMLEAARISGVKRFLQVSSAEVYPDTIKQPIKESYGFMKGLQEKIDGYAWSKRFSEIASKMYNVQYGMEISVARPSNIYGPRDHLDKGRVIPTFIKQAMKNEPISVWDGGKQKKSFLYVTDFANAVLGLVEQYKKFDPVNVAGERYITIRKLAEIIISLTNSESIIKDINAPDIVFKDRILDTQKIKKMTGFKEQEILEDGLKRTIQYLVSESKGK